MRRTKEEAAETRRQILIGAEELFLERGYENVTLDEIAAQVGTSRGAVHWHFGNKQGILFALKERNQLPLKELANSIEGNLEGQPLVLLYGMITDMLFSMHSDERRRGLIKLMLHLDIACDGNECSNDQQIYLAMERVFQEANRRNRLLPPWTPKTASSAVCAAIYGILEEWALERSEFPLIPYGQEMIRILLEGFQNSPSSGFTKPA